MNVLNLNGEWKLAGYDYREVLPETTAELGEPKFTLTATVPGEVHNDLKKAGMLEDVLFGDNHLKAEWVVESDWCYTREFTVGKVDHRTELRFDGLDLYATIYLNGKKVAFTENAHHTHHISVDGVVKEGVNTVSVYFSAVREVAKKFPKDTVSGCFDTSRLFMRKAQCQFSWDWAPALPAVGIWNDVKLITRPGHRIRACRFTTLLDGRVTCFFEIEGEGAKWSGDAVDYEKKLAEVNVPAAKRKYKVALTVTDGEKVYTHEEEFQDYKEYFNFKIDNPKLWWPHDMGDQPLYNYTFSYFEDGNLSDTVSGHFAIRTVEINEEPRDGDEVGLKFELLVNGERAFMKGGNWVPMDCFPGTVSDERYRRILTEAREGNINGLRIWGGGIYEKDIFYDLCDELGILIWQDFMFACGDLPDHYEGFMDLVIEETKEVVRRLQNHPCIALWCGGNEMMVPYGYFWSKGDDQVFYTLRGIVNALDPTRRYVEASPFGYNYLGGMNRSGDYHASCYNCSDLNWNVRREQLKAMTGGMVTEIGNMGFPPLTSLKKYIPEEDMKRDARTIDLHFVRNPHDPSGKGFLQVENELADDMFGPSKDFYEFIKKSACVQNEFVKLDVGFQRSRKGNCSAALLWMYNDTWPCGTWSIMDYYLEPKSAYYAMKETCMPIGAYIVDRKDGHGVFVVNDTRKAATGTLTVGQMDVDGTVVFQITMQVTVPALTSAKVYALDGVDKTRKNSFAFSLFECEGYKTQSIYFPQLWHEIEWPEPNLTAMIKQKDAHTIEVTLKTEKYARFVRLQGLGDGVKYSDNYFDILPGGTKVVTITAEKEICAKDITVDHWLTEWTE